MSQFNVNKLVHPGSFIRESVLPTNMTVKRASEILQVGRPALSNLLNGKAALSPEMALRIEKAFGAKGEDLLKLQATFDEQQARSREKEIAVRAYAPSFLAITATQINAWADRIDTRPLLPVLLRRLVQTTVTGLSKVDFPAYDNSQRHGWDGQVESNAANPWAPAGVSGWEFGCDLNPQSKAEHDYDARTKSVSPSVQKRTTFVFVTPRNWTGKDKWAKTKKSEKKWRDVKALDASDIEQWLEQSVPAQSWLAEKLGIASDSISSLEAAWDEWAKVTEPEFSKKMFRGQVDCFLPTLQKWLSAAPAQPFVITADSIEEALAFLACAFEAQSPDLETAYDRVLIFRTAKGLQKAAKVSSQFVAVLATAEVETISSGIQKRQHTIILRTKNAVEGEPDAQLDLIDDKTFRDAIIDMGIDENDVSKYARESGQSATVLRRRLAQLPAIKTPPWSQPNETVRKLIPLFFAGVWDSGATADQEILSLLAREISYSTVEDWVMELSRFEQTPVWSVGRYRGIVSKTDALFAIYRSITRSDLEHFFIAAEYVLSEDDPSLEMPEEERWTAGMYGKTRNHSSALRESICETLVLLAVHGNHLLRDRIGIDIEGHIRALIRRLLTPLKSKTWASQQSDLPRYAEAAPEEFLDIVENDLNSSDPQILELLRPASSGVFGSCSRSGLLWALEALAWKPERMARVAFILARLSQQKIDDNWANKPEATLEAIFRSWMPQTAATVEQRMAVLETLVKRYPDVGWRICAAQFAMHSRIGTYSYRPRWRKDATGAGLTVTPGEDFQTRRKALDITIEWPSHSGQTLSDLVEQMHGFLDEDQQRIWKKIEDWIDSGVNEEQKAELREHIRRHTFTRRGRKKNLSTDTLKKAQSVYQQLTPEDVVVRNQWLFARQWVDESYEELESEDFDFRKREERIKTQRLVALHEVWGADGYDGILRLCESGDAANVIGWLLAEGVINANEHGTFIARLAAEPSTRIEVKIDNLLSGYLRQLEEQQRIAILSELTKLWQKEGHEGNRKINRITKAAPFLRSTWDIVKGLTPEQRANYWREVYPNWGQFNTDDLQEVIDRLLEFNRPRAGIHAAHLGWEKISSPWLVRLLREAVTNTAEPSSHYRINGYEIAEAMKVLSKRSDVTKDELAQLEFYFLPALEDTDYGIPNLELQLAESPALFSQLVGLIYKRTDEGEDPAEWRMSSNNVEAVATQAYRLLHRARRIPGTGNDGSIDVEKLKVWISESRSYCRNYAREAVGDHAVGELLAKSPPGADGIWPCEAVRDAIEATASKDMADGVALGVYNGRGAVWRGPGGEQERELASKYRGWANEVAISTPFVSKMLGEIARHYDRDAVWHDTDAEIRKRMRY